MDFEIRSLDSQIRTKYTNRILSYKAELNRLCQEYSKLKNKIPKYRKYSNCLYAILTITTAKFVEIDCMHTVGITKKKVDCSYYYKYSYSILNIL